MTKPTITALLVLLAVAAAPTWATGPGVAQMNTAMTSVRHEPLWLDKEHYLYPFAGAAFIDGFGMHWFVIGLYYLEPSSGATRQNEGDYVARILDRDTGRPRERWVSGQRCSALAPLVKSMTTLHGPEVNYIPGPLQSKSVKDAPMEIAFDPPAYVVWGTGREEPGTLVEVELSGDSSSHVGEWVTAVQDGLQACWTPKPPLPLTSPPK
jgi:hypothetical protein